MWSLIKPPSKYSPRLIGGVFAFETRLNDPQRHGRRYSADGTDGVSQRSLGCEASGCHSALDRDRGLTEVDGFYWTVLVPDIVNSGREEQGLVSV